MLHLYYGTDVITARTKALQVAHDASAPIERFESETFTVHGLENAAGAVSLFGEATTFIIDSPSQNQEMWTELGGVASALQESPQLFVVIEGNLLAAQLKVLQPYLDEKESFTKTKTNMLNIFALADAFSIRDKKTLWILLVEAHRQGLSAEEIIGTLWWQVKSMRVAMATNSASEAGMKDYPYNKAKRAIRNFKPGELEALSEQLLQVYHEGHGGEKDIWIGLEEWALGV